jgi:hypothetical protein
VEVAGRAAGGREGGRKARARMSGWLCGRGVVVVSHGAWLVVSVLALGCSVLLDRRRRRAERLAAFRPPLARSP